MGTKPPSSWYEGSNNKTQNVWRNQPAHTSVCRKWWENPPALQRRPIFAAPGSSTRFRSWAEEENNTLLAAEIRQEAFFLLSLLSQLCAPLETKLPEEKNKLRQRETKVKIAASTSLQAPSGLQFSLIIYFQCPPCGVFITLKRSPLESKGHGHYR